MKVRVAPLRNPLLIRALGALVALGVAANLFEKGG
jgi:hypothetical protein